MRFASCAHSWCLDTYVSVDLHRYTRTHTHTHTQTGPYCRFEIRLAVAMSIPIITVKEMNRNRPGFADFDQLKKECPVDLIDHVLTNVVWIPYRRQQHEVDSMAKKIESDVFLKVKRSKLDLRSVEDIERLKQSDAYREAFEKLDAELKRQNMKPRPEVRETIHKAISLEKSPMLSTTIPSITSNSTLTSATTTTTNSTEVTPIPNIASTPSFDGVGTPHSTYRTPSRSSTVSSFSLLSEVLPIQQWLERFRKGFGKYSAIFEELGIEHSDIFQDLDKESVNDILDAMKAAKAPRLHIRAMERRLEKLLKANEQEEEEEEVVVGET